MQRIASVIVLAILVGGRGLSQPSSDVTLGIEGRANATPSIAASGSRVAVAWSAREPGGQTDIFVATSADGGRTFRPPVRVNDEPGTARVGGEMPPRVVFAGSAIEVLWTSRGAATSIRIARSEDDGRTFGASRELQQPGAAGDRGWPAVAAGANAAVHALWLDHRGLAGQDSHHVRGAAADAGAARDGVAMAMRSGLYYAGAGGEREIAKGVCYCCKTALAAAPDGTLFAAWRHVFAGNIRDIAFTASRDGGRTFAPFVRVSEDKWQLDGCPDDGPALAVDGRGVAHLVWPTVVTTPEPHKAIFHASTRDGRAFTPRARVSPVGRNAAHPQIALDSSGRPFVVWDEIEGGRRRLFAARGAQDGFLPPMVLDTAATAFYPTVARSGRALLVAWTEGASASSVIRLRHAWVHP